MPVEGVEDIAEAAVGRRVVGRPPCRLLRAGERFGVPLGHDQLTDDRIERIAMERVVGRHRLKHRERLGVTILAFEEEAEKDKRLAVIGRGVARDLYQRQRKRLLVALDHPDRDPDQQLGKAGGGGVDRDPGLRPAQVEQLER